ncbi:hypothetical protein C8J56DRAFT_780294, partial [Mycena floridula]
RPGYHTLSEVFRLDFPPDDTEDYFRLACFFAAYRKATNQINQYLRDPPSTSSPQYPDVSSFCAPDGSDQSFTYIRRMFSDKLVFQAATKDGISIIVKFTMVYSAPAHQWCAANGYAPGLLGFEEIGADWKMIVMPDLTTEYELDDTRFHSAQQQTNLKNFLQHFHEAGFVHGDLRDINFLFPRNPTNTAFQVLDFDWSGRVEDKPRYPPFLNPAIIRHRDALDGQIITQDHDRFMLNRLLFPHLTAQAGNLRPRAQFIPP